MIGIPSEPENGTVEIELPLTWGSEGQPAYRVAEVGAPVLTYVAVLSAAEAAAINDEYKKSAAEELQRKLQERGPGYTCQHLDEARVRGAKEVEQLLAKINQRGYFSSWVLIESCTYD
jgi:hypothetical protein